MVGQSSKKKIWSRSGINMEQKKGAQTWPHPLLQSASQWWFVAPKKKLRGTTDGLNGGDGVRLDLSMQALDNDMKAHIEMRVQLRDRIDKPLNMNMFHQQIHAQILHHDCNACAPSG